MPKSLKIALINMDKSQRKEYKDRSIAAILEPVIEFKKKRKEEKIGERKKKKTEQDIATENGEGSKMIAADTSEKKGRTTEQKDTKRVKKKKSEKLLSDSTAKRESRKTEKQKSDSTRIKQKKKTSKNTSVNKKPAAPDSTGVVR